METINELNRMTKQNLITLIVVKDGRIRKNNDKINNLSDKIGNMAEIIENMSEDNERKDQKITAYKMKFDKIPKWILKVLCL